MSHDTAKQSPRILVADDDPQVLRFFVRILRTAGYEVVEAKDGKQALARLRTTPCSLLILDLSMPEMDGFDVLRVLHSEMPEMKVIAVSGYKEGALLPASSFLGAMETLHKPMTSQQLIDTVERLLAGKTRRTSLVQPERERARIA